MKQPLLAIVVATGIGTVAMVDVAGQDPADRAANATAIERGKYLVHHVAMCIQCHTPHREDGSLDTQELLAGAAMPVRSPFPNQEWAFRAPKLAGLPSGWSEQQLTEFLQSGKTPTEYAVRPPMPPYRMTPDDAAAVAAYLKSLTE